MKCNKEYDNDEMNDDEYEWIKMNMKEWWYEWIMNDKYDKDEMMKDDMK